MLVHGKAITDWGGEDNGGAEQRLRSDHLKPNLKSPCDANTGAGVRQGVPSVDDGNHGKSGFLCSAKECGTRCLCWDITFNGIETCSYRRDVFLAIVGRPDGDKSLGHLTE